jgi:hypothetical protein
LTKFSHIVVDPASTNHLDSADASLRARLSPEWQPWGIQSPL